MSRYWGGGGAQHTFHTSLYNFKEPCSPRRGLLLCLVYFRVPRNSLRSEKVQSVPILGFISSHLAME